MVAQQVRIPVSARALFYKNLQDALQSAYGPTRTAVLERARLCVRVRASWRVGERDSSTQAGEPASSEIDQAARQRDQPASQQHAKQQDLNLSESQISTQPGS